MPKDNITRLVMIFTCIILGALALASLALLLFTLILGYRLLLG